jgi:PAS domain S-box-containing protein
VSRLSSAQLLLPQAGQQSHPLRYGAALAASLVAVVLAMFLRDELASSPFALLLTATTFSVWFGGLGPGLLAIGVGAVATDYFFEDPPGTLELNSPDTLVQLAVFVGTAMFISSLIGRLRAQSLRAEDALRASGVAETRFRGLLESAPDAVVIVDKHGEIRLVNGQAEQMFAAPRAELLGKPVELLIPPAMRSVHAQHRAGYEAAPRTRPMGTQLDLLGRRSDGTEFPVEISLSHFVSDTGPVTTAIIRDVTQRKHEEAAQALLVETSRVLATSLEDDAALAEVARLVVPRLADGCAIEVIGADGRPRRVAAIELSPGQQDEVSKWPLEAHGRRLGKLLLRIGPDRHLSATDLRVIEELAGRCSLALENARLYQAARDAIRAREEFLSVASHELRTPVTAISGLLQLMLKRMERQHFDVAQTRPALEDLNAHARRLVGLVVHLLDTSRIERGGIALKLEDTDLTRLVRDTVRLAHSQSPSRVVMVTVPPALPARADPARLEQVVTNLLDNAIKYSPQGGPIEVELKSEEPSMAQLSVRDHGLGIPPDRRLHIFDWFYRAHSDQHLSGLGIGLAVSHHIIAAHGGSIRAEFPADGGTRFLIAIPTGVPAVTEPAGSPEPVSMAVG